MSKKPDSPNISGQTMNDFDPSIKEGQFEKLKNTKASSHKIKLTGGVPSSRLHGLFSEVNDLVAFSFSPCFQFTFWLTVLKLRIFLLIK